MHPLTAPVYQTAFPATSEAPLPDPRLFDTPMDFRLQTTGKGLDWIYHLTAQRRREGEASASLIPKVPLTRLEALLKTLAEELGVRGNYLVQARECFHGQEPFCQGGCTGKAYHPNTTWNGRSHELALVIALFAASEDHPIALPDWVMFSGALKRGSLRSATLEV